MLTLWLKQLPLLCQATRLKKDEADLLKQRWELQALEEERKRSEQGRQKIELG